MAFVSARAQQNLAQLEHNLEELGGACFDFRLRISGNSPGSELIVVPLSRAIGGAGIILERLERVWMQLHEDVRKHISSVWEDVFQRLLTDLKVPCLTCSEASYQEIKTCVLCRGRLSSTAMQLEEHVKDFLARLEPMVYFPNLTKDLVPGENATSGFYDMVHDMVVEQRLEIQSLSQRYAKSENELVIVRKELSNTYHQLEQANKDLETVLGIASPHLEAFAKDLTHARQSANFQMAAQEYDELHKLAVGKLARQKLRNEDDAHLKQTKVESLGWKHQSVVARKRFLKVRGTKPEDLDYQAARDMAKEVWAERKALPDTTSMIRSSMKTYCSTLCLGKEYEPAERLYIYEWYSEDLCGPTDRIDLEWKLKIGFKLGCVLGKQARYLEAEAYHKRVLDIRKKLSTRKFKEEAESVTEIISALKSQGKWNDMNKILDDFWKAKPKEVQFPSVLDCDKELGVYLHKHQKNKLAEPILKRVWEGKRTFGDTYISSALSCAEALVEVYSCLGDYGQAEKACEWICTERKRKYPKQPETLEHCYYLGVFHFKQSNLLKAETVFKEIWEEQKKPAISDYKTADMQTLDCGHHYGEVLVRQGKYTEVGVEVTREVFQAKGNLLGWNSFDTLECGNTHGTMLMFLKRFSEAVTVLQEVWNGLDNNKESWATQENDWILSTTPNLVYCLLGSHKSKLTPDISRIPDTGLKWIDKFSDRNDKCGATEEDKQKLKLYREEMVALRSRVLYPKPTLPPMPEPSRMPPKRILKSVKWFAGGRL